MDLVFGKTPTRIEVGRQSVRQKRKPGQPETDVLTEAWSVETARAVEIYNGRLRRRHLMISTSSLNRIKRSDSQLPQNRRRRHNFKNVRKGETLKTEVDK